MDELHIFDFERDFAGSLRCIPMVVRFKLDVVGVKLSLRQWSRFGHRDRELLVGMPCEMPDEVADYRAFLIFLIESFADEPVKTVRTPAAALGRSSRRGARGLSKWPPRGHTR